jgi:hypothetical protein
VKPVPSSATLSLATITSPHRAWPSQAQRADAERVAKRQQAVPGDQRDHRIRALDAPMHGATALNTSSGVSGRSRAASSSSCASTLISTSVSLSVLMWRRSMANSSALQRVGVGQVAVVHQHDAEGRVDVERLRLFLVVGIAGRRVAHLAQAHVAGQAAHVARAEHVAHHAARLVHEALACPAS